MLLCAKLLWKMDFFWYLWLSDFHQRKPLCTGTPATKSEFCNGCGESKCWVKCCHSTEATVIFLCQIDASFRLEHVYVYSYVNSSWIFFNEITMIIRWRLGRYKQKLLLFSVWTWGHVMHENKISPECILWSHGTITTCLQLVIEGLI